MLPLTAGAEKPADHSRTHSIPAADLEDCLRDLVSVLALPSFCRGRSQAEAMVIVVDSARTLLHAELAYAHLKPPQQAVEPFWFANPEIPVAAIRALVAPAIEANSNSAVTVPNPSGGAPLRLIFVPIGFYAEAGALVLGSTRPDFPRPLEVITTRAIASLTSATLDNARLLEVARESERRKDDFMALLGHELRNPLAPILTALQLMKLRNVGGEKERGIIERQTHHMVQLVNDLFDISRLTRGTVELDKKEIGLSDVAAQAIEMAAPLIEKHRHLLQVSIDSGLRVNGDATRLAQVFSNLLTNAARYTEPGGQIHLEARRTDAAVEVRVRDNGRGIEEEMLEKVFILFFQTDRGKDALSGGLGLGLALVKSLVELHGGTVAASSAGRGKGALFTVTLPLARPSPTVTHLPAPSPPAEPAAVPRCVLVVDDNHDAADLLAELLRASGHEVRVAYDGAGALTLLAARFEPAFALLDLGMPGMDGYELAQRVREKRPKTVLVALSGYTEAGARAKSLAVGFAHHLAKPVNLEVVNGLLNSRGSS